MVTLVGLQAPVLFGGAVILEQIFVIPGMGLLLLEAVSSRDYPVITGVFLIIGVSVVMINLLVDLSYGWLDPRVREPLMADIIERGVAVARRGAPAEPLSRLFIITAVPRKAARRLRLHRLRDLPVLPASSPT